MQRNCGFDEPATHVRTQPWSRFHVLFYTRNAFSLLMKLRKCIMLIMICYAPRHFHRRNYSLHFVGAERQHRPATRATHGCSKVVRSE